MILNNMSLCRIWRPQAHRCQPNTAQGALWPQAKRAAVVRVWARLCAHSRGEGRAMAGNAGGSAELPKRAGPGRAQHAAHKRKGQRGPNATMRRTEGTERGSEEARPARAPAGARTREVGVRLTRSGRLPQYRFAEAEARSPARRPSDNSPGALSYQLLAGWAGRSAETPTVGTERARRHNEPKQCRDKAIPGRIGGAPLCFGSGAG